MYFGSARTLIWASVARMIRPLVRLHPAVRHHTAVKNGKRILVKIHGGAGVGDVIMCTPSLRALRHGHPNAYIACMVSKAHSPVLLGCPYIDEIISVEQAAASRLRYVTQLAKYLRLVIRLAAYHFDFSVELKQGTPPMLRQIPVMAGIEHRYGPRVTDPWHSPEAYSVRVPLLTDSTQVVRFMEVAVAAGGIPDGEETECYVSLEWRKSVANLLGPVDSRPLIVVHPGSNDCCRRWPEASFAKVINDLQADQPVRILLIGVTAEIAVINHIAVECRCAVETIVSVLDLGELQALIERADLLLCNDSGPMHMAIALGTPVVAVFGPTNPDKIVGLNPPDWCRLIRVPADCPPRSECPVYACMSGKRRRQVLPICSTTDAVCVDAVSVQPVLEAARGLLACKRSSTERLSPRSVGVIDVSIRKKEAC